MQEKRMGSMRVAIVAVLMAAATDSQRNFFGARGRGHLLIQHRQLDLEAEPLSSPQAFVQARQPSARAGQQPVQARAQASQESVRGRSQLFARQSEPTEQARGQQVDEDVQEPERAQSQVLARAPQFAGAIQEPVRANKARGQQARGQQVNRATQVPVRAQKFARFPQEQQFSRASQQPARAQQDVRVQPAARAQQQLARAPQQHARAPQQPARVQQPEQAPVFQAVLSQPDVQSQEVATGQLVTDSECPELEGLQVYPHLDSCNHFYKCANGTLTLETCGNGLLFNEDTANAGSIYNHCSYNWQTNCHDRKNDSTPISSSGCPYQFGIFSVGDGCFSSYTKCAHGKSEEVYCQLGLAYDDQIHNCNYPDLLIKSAGCDPEAAFGFSCPLEFELTPLERRFWPFPRFAFTKDPMLYILCVNDLPRLRSCGNDHIFSTTELTCKWSPAKI